MSTIKTFTPLALGITKLTKGLKGTASVIKGLPDAFDTLKIKGMLAADSIKGAFAKTTATVKDLFTQTNKGKFSGLLQSAHSAGGFKNLSTLGRRY